jgi:hypothetical protein
MRKSHKRTIGAVACVFTAAGMAFAASSMFVTFETGAVPTGTDDCDAPDICDPLNWTNVFIEGDGAYINGELEKRDAPFCEPDTYLVCFDKLNDIVAQDDNGSNKGNGWGSGLVATDADCFIDNGDNTRSLRLGVTGRRDGLDGMFNGLFMNGPHGELGCFLVCVDFIDAGGAIISSETYEDEFLIGAEAFHINYTVPPAAVAANINIDNTCGSVEVRCDVDFMKLINLVPLCDYCIEQIGGINCECRPTDTKLGWFDKSCNLLLFEGTGGAVPEYAKLCVVADTNGEVNLAVSGENDSDFNGLDDMLQDAWFDAQASRALGECPAVKPGHGEAGCYTLKVSAIGDHSTNPPAGAGGEAAIMQQALDNGDLNMDGVTNTADLGILIGNFGWVSGL